MLARSEAQGLTDAFAALALGAYVAEAARRGVRGPLEQRLAFAFGGLCLFFAFRAAAEILSSPALNLLAELVACWLPLAGLVLAEGVLRRHAPGTLKLAIALGAVTISVGLIAVGGRPPLSSLGLGSYVSLSIFAVTLLLLFRDRTSLSQQENASITMLMVAAAGLTLLSLTDFLPDAPVGMSGVGASLLAFVAATNSQSARDGHRTWIDLSVVGSGAGLFAIGLAPALGLTTASAVARLAVVGFALVIAVVAVLGSLRETMKDDESRSLRRALARADMGSLWTFLESLAGQPLLGGLTLAEGASLADYDHDALIGMMTARPVWSRQTLKQAEPPHSDRGREELTALLAQTEATHAVLASSEPLRIALLTLPAVGSTEETEADLALFSKFAVLASEPPR